MKKKYKAPLAEVLELEIDETICFSESGDGNKDNEGDLGEIL